MPKKLTDLADGLESWVQDMQSAVGSNIVDVPPDVGDWAVQSRIMLDRGLFSFKKHEYLKVPYSDNHLYVMGVLYLFPSKAGADDFSRTRISPLVNNNPESINLNMK